MLVGIFKAEASNKKLQHEPFKAGPRKREEGGSDPTGPQVAGVPDTRLLWRVSDKLHRAQNPDHFKMIN